MTITEAPVDYHCPTWCERTDHAADYVGPHDQPMHFGPEFPEGPVLVAVQSQCNQPLEAIIYAEGDLTISEPAELRRLAAEILRAAEWMQAHQ